MSIIQLEPICLVAVQYRMHHVVAVWIS